MRPRLEFLTPTVWLRNPGVRTSIQSCSRDKSTQCGLQIILGHFGQGSARFSEELQNRTADGAQFVGAHIPRNTRHLVNECDTRLAIAREQLPCKF